MYGFDVLLIYTRFCWKLRYIYVIRWFMTEIIYFQNYYWQLHISAIYDFLQINLCDRLGASNFRSWSTRTLRLRAFSVIKLDLFIRALTLDHILALDKTTRTSRVHLVIQIYFFNAKIMINCSHVGYSCQMIKGKDPRNFYNGAIWSAFAIINLTSILSSIYFINAHFL